LKDYSPGCYDLCFGGVVAAHEMDDVTLSAKREAEEEMGLPDLSLIDPSSFFETKKTFSGTNWSYWNM